MELTFSEFATTAELPKIFDLEVEKQKKEHAGAGSCSECSCASYDSGGYGNDFCTCGHSYSAHW